MSDPAPVDTVALMAEIDEEVRRRRSSGELGEFERELDRTFARFAPVDAVDADFDTIVAKVEQAAVIDTRPPTLSSRPGVAAVKQGVAKASGFYVRHVATQVSGLIQGVTRALRLLDERVDALEQQGPGPGRDLWRRLQHRDGLAKAADPGGWADLVLGQVTGGTGRVLHTEAGDGGLVAALVAAGVDAYGVEPDAELALAASDRAPDIRSDDAVTHLEMLPPRTLRGVVLSGCVERRSGCELVDLAALAVSRLAPGGALVVISSHPRAWARSVSPVTLDLAGGRPLHPETWAVVLAGLRCSGVAVHLGGADEELRAVGGTGPLAETVDANTARLNALLFGPSAYVVTAVAAA